MKANPVLLMLVLVLGFSFPARAADTAVPVSTAARQLAAAERLQSYGKRRLALQALQQARTATTEQDSLDLKLSIAGALGKAYLLNGQPQEAGGQLQAALALALDRSLPRFESVLRNELGLLAISEGHLATAQQEFDIAIQAALRSGDDILLVRTRLNKADLLRREGRHALANELLVLAAQPLAHAASNEETADLLLRWAQLSAGPERNAADLPVIFHTLSRAAEIAQRLRLPRIESFALGHLGELYVDNGRHIEAAVLARRALFLAQNANATDTLFRWHWLLARIHRQSGRPVEAIAAYRRALNALQSVHHDLMADLRLNQISYRGTVGPLFQEYADLLLQQAAATPPDQGDAILRLARDAIEQLKTVELEDYFQDSCVTSMQNRRASLDEVPAGTAVLYPILLPDRVEMLLGTSDGIRQFRLGIDSQALSEKVETFRRLLEKRTTREYLPYAQELFDLLLRPLEADLARHGIHTLVIVPDGALRGIPLGALHDGKRFAIERYALAVAPGLSLVETPASGQRPVNSLLGGITESVQNFPALPYVDPEVSSIQAITGGKALKNIQFNISNFEHEIHNSNYSIIHIASHGQIENDPRKSFLLAYDGRITMDNLEGYMKHSRFRIDPVELLTLSACRTAAGDERAALGLAGVAVKAGARSALATLWYVSDQASSMLVTEFYRLLSSRERTKAQALQDAQRMVLADPRYRHPGYWSPFLLIGNWQ